MMTITDRNKYAFVTICYGLLSLLLGATTTITTVAASAPFEASVQPQAAASASASASATTTTSMQQQQDEVNAMPGAATVRAFSPRMDYNNEWRPLGHGDPLKNDPTYDYSPPALERVRYWAADNGSGSSGGGAVDKNANKEQNKTKSEILLLGVSNERERIRGQQQPPMHHQQQQQHEQIHMNQHKNGVGVIKANESPLLQPKYTSIRRSYYAQQPHQMPHTHLMPPPMYQAAMTAMPTPPQLIMKNSAPSSDHRHPNNNYMAGTSTAGHQHMMMSSMHSKPYYSTAATSPWLHHSTPHMAHASDAQHLESMQHYSFTRPSTAASAHGGMSSTQVIHSYSPNAIHTYGQAGNKQSAAPRKPWLHELLQKELVKPTKQQSSRPHYDVMTKPSYGGASGVGVGGISTTYAPFTYTPVTFVSAPPTIATRAATTTTSPLSVSTDTQGAIYITPTPHTTAAPPSPAYSSETGFRPMLMSSSSSPPSSTTPSPLSLASSSVPTPTYTPPTATTTNSRLLIIPTMSNLAYRPTVAPIELTTDALFKHYKQPKKPLAGPMYLIIEGHSKVKTYGQNELDPHQPKIVPIIPKREPIIRIADPNEKRGTVETFQVKHLHTTSTTPMPKTSTTTVSPTTTTTTAKTVQPTIITTRATMAQPAEHAEGGGFAATGIQSVLSLLDIFTDNAMPDESGPASQPQLQPNPTERPIPKLSVNPASTTVLRPVTTAKPKIVTTTIKQAIKPQQPEPRISSKAGAITSEDDEEDNEEAGKLVSTEEPPRSTRQVFDYDQLPESRLKELPVDDDEHDDDEVYDYVSEDVHNDDAEDATSVEDPTAEGYADDESHKLLKRIDSFLDDVDEDDDDNDNNNNDDDDNEDAEELTESNELDDLADLAEGFEDATT